MVDVSPPNHHHAHLHLGHGDDQVGEVLLPEVAIRLGLRTHPNIFRPRRTSMPV